MGPSAHSFNKQTRSWNIANNNLYIKGIESGNLVSEVEELTIENRINEYIMTSLRTIWGLDIRWFENEFGSPFAKTISAVLQQKIRAGLIEQNGHFYKLTRQARIMADGIASDLFV